MTEEEIIKMLNNFPQIEVVKYILTIQENEENLKNNLNQASELLIKKDNKIENLQQRIDKAVDELNGYCPCDDNEIYERTEKVLSILTKEQFENNCYKIGDK